MDWPGLVRLLMERDPGWGFACAARTRDDGTRGPSATRRRRVPGFRVAIAPGDGVPAPRHERRDGRKERFPADPREVRTSTTAPEKPRTRRSYTARNQVPSRSSTTMDSAVEMGRIRTSTFTCPRSRTSCGLFSALQMTSYSERFTSPARSPAVQSWSSRERDDSSHDFPELGPLVLEDDPLRVPAELLGDHRGDPPGVDVQPARDPATACGRPTPPPPRRLGEDRVDVRVDRRSLSRQRTGTAGWVTPAEHLVRGRPRTPKGWFSSSTRAYSPATRPDGGNVSSPFMQPRVVDRAVARRLSWARSRR